MHTICMYPTPREAAGDFTNAINQIVIRLQRALPAHGYAVNDHEAPSDLIACHAGQSAGRWFSDVAHCHGLYPTARREITNNWHFGANASVIKNLRQARYHTVPSDWVGEALRRDMHIVPAIVPWAIDASEWTPGVSQGFVLWNKTRPEGVCSPLIMNALAARVPRRTFVSTFGASAPNVQLIGRRKFEEMRQIIPSAGVYLASTKETFGIGTLEAMACGVPILGVGHGATPEIVRHGIDGYIAAPGDLEDLLEGLEFCFKYRDTLGANARDRALTYTWDNTARLMARVYDRAMRRPVSDVKVCVVVPCYNYAGYLREAVTSVLNQQTPFPFEVVIVNDGSSDNSAQVAQELMDSDPRVFVVNQPNQGVAHARNAGIGGTTAEYIVCLDADDRLGNPNFLAVLAEALDKDPELGIAYSGLWIMAESGRMAPTVAGWPDGFNYEAHLQAQNQVPTCCMFRRTAWSRTGGYRQRYFPAEDADLWLRIMSIGYLARQATKEGWLHYRMHSNSQTAQLRVNRGVTPDWTGDKGWIKANKKPFAAPHRDPGNSWPLRDYDDAVVTVIIPVGPYHTHLIEEALDSVEAQTEHRWRVLVVNDSGRRLDLRAWPWAHVITTQGAVGASAARNIGIRAAETALIAFLDADDTFHPEFLELTLRAYAATGRYVYTDWTSITKDGRREDHITPEYTTQAVFRQTSIHSINVLLRREWALEIGGFDESMRSWEDVKFYMALAVAGHCGVRVPRPLVVYRYNTGMLREQGAARQSELIALLYNQFKDYMEGRKMCGCSEPRQVQQSVGQGATFRTEGSTPGGRLVLVTYNGAIGSEEIYGPATRTYYGRRARGDTFYVHEQDVEVARNRFVPVVTAEAEQVRRPAPAIPERVTA